MAKDIRKILIGEEKFRNYVAIILDRSGSMNAMRHEIVEAFNEQVDTIKANAGNMPTFVSLVTFADVAGSPFRWNVPAKEIDKMDMEEYNPSGLTALYDAIGLTIKWYSEMEDAQSEFTSFLLVIISDGFENNSKTYDEGSVAELIQSVQKTDRWTFTYIGKREAEAVAINILSIPQGNYAPMNFTSEGLVAAGVSMSMGTHNYFSARSKGEQSISNYYADSPTRKKEEDNRD